MDLKKLSTVILPALILGCSQKPPAPSSTENQTQKATTSIAPTGSHTQNQGEVSGVDLSKWQGDVDFPKIKLSGKTFTFIKATQGATDIDPNYMGNLSKSRAAGLATGSYHFYMTDDDPSAQFSNFAHHVTIKPGDLPPVIDIETFSKNTLPDTAAKLTSFIHMVEEKYGVKPILYSGEHFANQYLENFGEYPLWLAEYNSDKEPALPRGWSRWTIWQHTQNGSVAGVSGHVDLDRFNGGIQQFQRLVIH